MATVVMIIILIMINKKENANHKLLLLDCLPVGKRVAVYESQTVAAAQRTENRHCYIGWFGLAKNIPNKVAR